MIEEIVNDIFRIEIPIPENPLGATNSYVIRGKNRYLIVDTGLDGDIQLSAMMAALQHLNVDLTKTDIFITHLHPDHIGLAHRMIHDGCKVYLNSIEARWIKENIGFPDVKSFAVASGFPGEEVDAVFTALNTLEVNFDRKMTFHVVEDSDTLTVGEYALQCISTPGHSRGHLCLYEAEKKLLFAGDHLLKNITPALQAMWVEEWDPLKEYLESLEKIKRVDVELVLPGHMQPFRDHRVRIAELKEHHAKRLEEVIHILQDGAKNAFRVSALMTWNVAYDSWETFPSFHKMIAVGEALAHLRCLVGLRKLEPVLCNGTVLYSLL